MYVCRDGAVLRNPVGPFPDPAALPPEDYELFDLARIVGGKDGWMSIITSRGCPFACTYCFNAEIVARYKQDGALRTVREYLRHQPVGRVIDGDVLAMNGASAALCLSPLPFQGPLGAVRLGRGLMFGVGVAVASPGLRVGVGLGVASSDTTWVGVSVGVDCLVGVADGGGWVVGTGGLPLKARLSAFSAVISLSGRPCSCANCD